MSRRALGALVAASCTLAACGEAEPRRIRLELLTRTSCPRDYRIDCVQALQVQLVDHARGYRAQCSVLAGRYATLEQLAVASGTLAVLEDVRLRDEVRVEVRGFHAFDKEACAEPADADLVFWGSSVPLDLTDAQLDEVRVSLECRPGCDCSQLDPAQPQACALALAPGICGPPVARPCAASGAECLACSSDADCGGRPCVRHVYASGSTSIDETFCSEHCPPLPDVQPCPAGMSCKALGEAFSRVSP